MAPSSLELTYFDAGGRADPIRMMLIYGDIAFEDIRIPSAEFADKKPSLDLPFDQVPTLNVEGKVFAQSIAIARYGAKMTGLYPEDALKALEADLAVDTVTEATMTVINAAFQEQDEEKKKVLLAEANEKILPRLLGGLEKRAVGPYYLGDTPSFPDFYVLDFHKQLWSVLPDVITLKPEDYPKLIAIADSLRSSSKLSAFINPKKRKLSSA
ncbi:unnamed protein product [Aphanomyces euteiches]|uniref:Glutathione S-transferase n=1 Tax=Aphanomyces euteiches TaxID=100861 RepID=A0A6G0X380_9STRA|nr:hypothetical protein Ae201684_008980 [Aphanomyces euteiches]KAH9054485.1 hypothetical protein Ae201684P_018202 [Aphanomyces euteiches]KAH9128283.1 hypothetical protein AeMF1_001545 [Aphanomyces euteiches]KAH9130573.1 hypothetical protein LEN26_008395 [Aphanomyces euteiches]KAH9195780.1 hypothetical protein AeNC1_002243 [Aphanomyces euteiches]